MDTLERNQIRLILEHLSSETLRKTNDLQNALYAEHSARGRLASGATIKRTVDNIENEASKFIEQAVDQVSSVAQDTDSFVLIVSSLTALFRGFDAHLRQSLKHANGRGSALSETLTSAGDNLFAEMRTRTFKQLEIHRFSFTKPSKGDLAARGLRVSSTLSQDVPKDSRRNPGGKPLADHWDKMWAAIAVMLWTGTLQPKSQADVKAAMFEWFNKEEIDVGDTALTQRARRLWQTMQDADNG